MNETRAAATLEMTGMLRKTAGSLAFLTARAKKSASELSVSTTEVFSRICDTLTGVLAGVIEKRTTAEFQAAFNSSFPAYVSLLSAVSNFATAVVPQQTIERLSRESLCEMEADFRNGAVAAFGQSVCDQALFTVWTMRKIADLVAQVNDSRVDAAHKAEDKACSEKFTFHAYRANFGLDCLVTALQQRIAIYPDVLDELTDCLRSAVNAYAWVRQGVDLRAPSGQQESALAPVHWDEEDEELLAAAMHDISDPEDEASL